MKTTVLWAFLALISLSTFAQAPTIAGDTMLCPEGFGTATVTNNQTYDSYQWQWRFAFTEDAFQDVAGANQSSFTYDHYNYSVTDIRLKVTLGGTTYYSNELYIDGYAFLGIFTIQSFNEDEVTINPNDGTLMLCQGATILFEVGMPYDTNVQWFNNGVAIPGATSTTLSVTEAGNYTVSGSPSTCPNFVQTSMPTAVAINTDCNLAVGNPHAGLAFEFGPNPIKSTLEFNASAEVSKVRIFDVSGKKLFETAPNALSGHIDLSALASGVYVMQVSSVSGTKVVKLAKQ